MRLYYLGLYLAHLCLFGNLTWFLDIYVTATHIFQSIQYYRVGITFVDDTLLH